MRTNPAFVLLSALLLLSLAPARARLGETREQLDARYGAGEVDDNPSSQIVYFLEGAQDIGYNVASGKVKVVLHQGKSVSERVEMKKPATRDADAKVLMEANSGGLRWTFRDKENRWHRSDNKAVGYFYNADWFVVADAAYLKACEKDKERNKGKDKDKGKGASKLQGF